MNKIEFVLVLLFTFFVIVVWITSEVILVKPNVPEDAKIQAMLEPVSASFDQETLNLISTQKPATYVPPVATPTPQPIATTTPSPSPTTRGRSTPTPSPTPQTATSSAATNPITSDE